MLLLSRYPLIPVYDTPETKPLERFAEVLMKLKELQDEHNQYGAQVRAGTISMARFRAYQDGPFEDRHEELWSEKVLLEEAILKQRMRTR